jgi:hypothetical protein
MVQGVCPANDKIALSGTPDIVPVFSCKLLLGYPSCRLARVSRRSWRGLSGEGGQLDDTNWCIGGRPKFSLRFGAPNFPNRGSKGGLAGRYVRL